MTELEMIRALQHFLRTDPRQRSQPFASDAEIFEFEERLVALTIDGFCAEDGFTIEDPELLGSNLIIATVSDLFAVGAVPQVLLNSMIAAPGMDAAFLTRVSRGMQTALQLTGGHMLGGDVGTAATWQFTGVALGTLAGSPLQRISSAAAGLILVSGPLGDGNLAAGIGGVPLRLECRLKESATLVAAADPDASVACLDTSDGLAVALANLAAVNPALRLVIDRRAIPYAAGIPEACAALDVPPETFLLGSAGEYELLVLWDDSLGPVPVGFQVIGWFDRSEAGGIFWQAEHDRPCALSPEALAQPELPDPRAADSLNAYRTALLALARAMFPERGEF